MHVPDQPHLQEALGALDHAVALAENFRKLIVIPIAVGFIALGVSFMVPPTFTASTRILPPPQNQGMLAMLATQLGPIANLAGGPSVKSLTDQYVALLKSRTVHDSIIQRFDLKNLYGTEFYEEARDILRDRTRITAGSKDGVITIEVQDRDPARASNMANAFVDELRALSHSIAITEAAQRRLFFEVQLKKTQEHLTKAELALRTSGISEAIIKTVPQSALDVLAKLKAQITAQEIKLASMRTFMTDANPELRLALQELTALRNELSKAEQSSGAKASGQGAEYIAKYRDFKYHETLYELMAKQYEIARLDEARDSGIVQVIDPAYPPEKRSKPRRGAIAAVAALVALLLTIAFVITRNALKELSRQPELAEKLRRLRLSFPDTKADKIA